jgi:hypothetical protein
VEQRFSAALKAILLPAALAAEVHEQFLSASSNNVEQNPKEKESKK